jgi:hypothetical protein
MIQGWFKIQSLLDGAFKLVAADADECDVENDHPVAEPQPVERTVAPNLPPRPAPPKSADDVWSDVEEEEPEHLHRHFGRSSNSTIFLLPTTAARVLATLGWIGGVLASVLLLVALVPDFRNGNTANFFVSLDDEPWYGATLIVSSAVIYLGWLWWSVSSCFNAHRLAPLSTSPWLPAMVYLVGPLIVLIGLDLESDYAPVVVFCGCAWLAIGHLMVIASMRSTAGRIGASVEQFSKLLWLPLAWGSYRGLMLTVVTFFSDDWKRPPQLLALGSIGVLFIVGIAFATWNATESFDHACKRLNTRSLGLELPTADMVTAAIRQRAVEGR